MLDIALEECHVIWRLITDYYNLYTIQLTAWTDAFGFDPRVSANENGPRFPRSGPITDWTDTSPLPKS